MGDAWGTHGGRMGTMMYIERRGRMKERREACGTMNIMQDGCKEVQWKRTNEKQKEK